MTYLTKNHNEFWSDFHKINQALSPFSIGIFDDFMSLQNQVINQKSTTGYPPYNIKKQDDQFTIEIAVAGFSKDEIDIEYADKTLTIKGSSKSITEEEEKTFVYKGISNRAFTRTFTLADTIEVVNAELEDGMLKITCKQWLPERLQKKTIPITNGVTATLGGDKKQLLNESR